MRTKFLSMALTLSAALLPVAALAGPCSDDIAAIGKQLSQSPALGPVTTGTLSGSVNATSQPATANTKGTSADNRVGGTAGTKEVNAASANVATSDADVRQQQMGHPTAAASTSSGKSVETAPGSQTASAGAPDDHMSRAKMAWQKAVDLNAQNNDSCKGAVNEARDALKAG
jgi:hypothetical protein